MNLTCTTNPSGGQTAGTGTVITIVMNWPGGSMPPAPPNSTELVAPDPNVEYEIAGCNPDGKPVPAGFKINGANVAVYSTSS